MNFAFCRIGILEMIIPLHFKFISIMTVIEYYISNYKAANPVNVFNNVSYKSTSEMITATERSNVNEPAVITASPFRNLLLFIPIFLLGAFYSYRSLPKSILNILPFVVELNCGYCQHLSIGGGAGSSLASGAIYKAFQ